MKKWMLIFDILLIGLVFFFILSYIKSEKVSRYELQKIESQMIDLQEENKDLKIKIDLLSLLASTQQDHQLQQIQQIVASSNAQIPENIVVTSVAENNGKINSINEQIESLMEQIQLLKNQKEENVYKIETAINNALVNISKPDPIVIKPMPNVTTTEVKVNLSQQEKEDISRQIKLEIFKKFVDAGYGTFDGEKLILNKPYYGAKINSGEEWKYKPE